ncbi:MAG TPA: DUF2505 domain-containing protein [Pseudonocardiaceae bacterium]|nr:DUF2505 domain-containing protein [Pseudonocardiaceae bacterium]
MARRIDHRSRSRWDAHTVYTALVDEAYLKHRLAAIGGQHAELVARTADADSASLKLRHGVAADALPQAVRVLLGGDLRIDRAETWRRDPAGGFTGTVAVTIPSMPGQLGGTQRLRDVGDQGSELLVDGSVAIPIPFVGGRIEETVVDQIAKLLDAEHQFTEEWLDRHRA